MFSQQDIFWMQHALQLAKHAFEENEIPIGAVLVRDDKVIGQGWNQPIQACDPTAHAEIIALRKAGQTAKNYRLVDTVLYVTLEPCLMCVGALVHARVKKVIFGAYDQKIGVVEATANLLLNHKIAFQGGLLAEECGEVLSRFFQAKRK